MTEYDHPDHGNIVEQTLDTRVHDNEETLFCERCRNHVPIDEPERFGELDCDQYKDVGDSISGNI